MDQAYSPALRPAWTSSASDTSQKWQDSKHRSSQICHTISKLGIQLMFKCSD